VDCKAHWDHVYQTVAPDRVSWFQPQPTLSLELIRRVAPRSTAAILDVGGGASTLVGHLLENGYRSVTVLDLSSTALSAARQRLGERGAIFTWLEADVLGVALAPSAYDVWHDRAVFHFLTDPEDRRRYAAQVHHAVRPDGYVIVAAFGPDGPTVCSGLPVVRYAPAALHAELGEGFHLVESTREQHRTPAGRSQEFIYCLFRFARRAERQLQHGV